MSKAHLFIEGLHRLLEGAVQAHALEAVAGAAFEYPRAGARMNSLRLRTPRNDASEAPADRVRATTTYHKIDYDTPKYGARYRVR